VNASPFSPDRPRPGEVDRSHDEDQLALAAACEAGVGLCTIVRIEGSFSRRLGAQLAVRADGSIIGSLSDGCLEQQLVRDCSEASAPFVQRYGSGASAIDFRLPCGGGLDILIDPTPDRAACVATVEQLRQRRPAALRLPDNAFLQQRPYIPGLCVQAFGEGPELTAFAEIAAAASIRVEAVDKGSLTLGRASGGQKADPWTAVVLLFHDHEWELALLEEALSGDAFYIGAQGGAQARAARLEQLQRRGMSPAELARLTSPIGALLGSRTPQTLALSALAEIAGEYERLRPPA